MLYASTIWFHVLHWEFAEGFSSPEANLTPTGKQIVFIFIKLNWLPLHLEVKVNICIQVYKRIYGHSPCYMNDLYGIKFGHDQNSWNSWALNLVCPGFKGETEVGQTSSVRAARSWNTIPNSLKKIEFAHKCAVIKRPQLTFMFSIFFVVILFTSYLQIFSRIFNCNFRLIYVYF